MEPTLTCTFAAARFPGLSFCFPSVGIHPAQRSSTKAETQQNPALRDSCILLLTNDRGGGQLGVSAALLARQSACPVRVDAVPRPGMAHSTKSGLSAGRLALNLFVFETDHEIGFATPVALRQHNHHGPTSTVHYDGVTQPRPSCGGCHKHLNLAKKIQFIPRSSTIPVRFNRYTPRLSAHRSERPNRIPADLLRPDDGALRVMGRANDHHIKRGKVKRPPLIQMSDCACPGRCVIRRTNGLQ